MLSPKEADKRLRSSGGEVEAHAHCCDGALDSGAEARLQTQAGGIRCGALRGAGKRAALKCSCVGWCMQSGRHLHARLLLVRAEMNFSAAMALGDCAEVARDTYITISSSGSRNSDGFRDRIPVCIILEARTGRRQCDGRRERWADGRRVPRRFNAFGSASLENRHHAVAAAAAAAG